jgi:hypothetical protein
LAGGAGAGVQRGENEAGLTAKIVSFNADMIWNRSLSGTTIITVNLFNRVPLRKLIC